MTDEALIARLRELGDHASFEPHMHHTAADRIEALIAERDQCIAHAKNAIWADSEELQAAEAKLKKAVEALGKLCGLAPVEKPPEPYDEYGWQIADTAERHAQMVLDRNLWAAADFARTTLAEIRG